MILERLLWNRSRATKFQDRPVQAKFPLIGEGFSGALDQLLRSSAGEVLAIGVG